MYNRGDSWKKAVDVHRRQLTGELKAYSVANIVTGVSDSEMRNSDLLKYWASVLVLSARSIRDELDQHVSAVLQLNDRWYSTDREKIKAHMIWANHAHMSIRAFEAEVDELMNQLAYGNYAPPSDPVTPVLSVRDGVVDTHSRLHHLCVSKLTSISSGRAAAGTMVLSVVAIVIALATLMAAA